MKILIADDDAGTIILLKKQLEAMGNEVLACENGDQVLEVLERNEPPPLLILDWLMPRRDGIEVCRKIRERETQEGVSPSYLVMLTVRDRRDDVLEGLRAGINDYITKPIRSDDLRVRINIGMNVIELQRRLREQRTHLIWSSKMATLAEMAGGIAHEINNPLSAIVGTAEALAGELSEDADILKQRLRVIHAMAFRISDIVSGLQAFAGEAQNAPFKLLNVNSLIIRSLQFFGEKMKATGVTLELKLDAFDAQVLGQEMNLVQALSNLLSNAQWAVSGSAAKEIHIITQADSDWVRIRIEDSGIGIPEGLESKVMQPFFTTKGPGKGIGLGLSVAHGIVVSQGGSLTLERVKNRTCLVVSLPIWNGTNGGRDGARNFF